MLVKRLNAIFVKNTDINELCRLIAIVGGATSAITFSGRQSLHGVHLSLIHPNKRWRRGEAWDWPNLNESLCCWNWVLVVVYDMRFLVACVSSFKKFSYLKGKNACSIEWGAPTSLRFHSTAHVRGVFIFNSFNLCCCHFPWPERWHQDGAHVSIKMYRNNSKISLRVYL